MSSVNETRQIRGECWSSNRIANVRTWSYVSNKNNWVENQNYWIEKTKLEDKLSDRLHEELTKTFIDKRASVLARG